MGGQDRGMGSAQMLDKAVESPREGERGEQS